MFRSFISSILCQYLPSATKLRRLCFYTCLSVILFTGVCVPAPSGGYLPTHPPRQVHTPYPGYTPQGYTPQAGTPPGRYTPQAGTPLRQVHPRQVPPLRAGTPPPSPQQTATVADGTHPTGMHSCSYSSPHKNSPYSHTSCARQIRGKQKPYHEQLNLAMYKNAFQ